MPELPEVETVRRGLMMHLPGRRIESVKVLREASIGYPSAREFTKKIAGHTFATIDRRGKWLLFKFENGAGMVGHLRMSGRFLVGPPGAHKSNHIRVDFELSDGRHLLFEDMRVFGRIWYVPKGKTFAIIVPGIGELGPEPLGDLTADFLQESFKNRTQAIKTAILDQTVIAGVGNIYADESLHLSKIHPLRPAKSLKSRELEILVEQIQEVLTNAIQLGGSSLRNYTDASGVEGEYQDESWVYGRKGETCKTCSKGTISRIKIAGRSAHFCPRCQRAR